MPPMTAQQPPATMQPPAGASQQPVDAGVATGEMQPPAMATPEQMGELQALIGKTRGAVGELSAMENSLKAKSGKLDSERLQQFFYMLESQGVNLEDPQSIADFLNKLKSTNPEVGEMIESDLEELLDKTDGQPIEIDSLGNEMQSNPEENDNEQQNEALSEDI